MGRILFWLIVAAAALVVLAAVAMRVPAVEDRLLDRALDRNFAPRAAALFNNDGLNVFFCGTGSPLPSKARAQTCTAVFAGDRFFLVDAGTGSWETIAATGIPGGKLEGIFLTHLHSDHIGDLSEANLGSWVGGRGEKLAVYGPSGVERIINGENEAFALDSGYRTAHHGESVAPTASAGMIAVPFSSEAANVIYDEGGLKVTAFPVEHDPVVGAVGFRFDYQGRSVVISGDTAYSETLVENAKGADLLIHEAQANHIVAKMGAAASKSGAANTAQILADIPSYHTSPEEAARAANEAGAERLVLTHLTPAPDNPVAKRIFMRGVKAVRASNVKLAEDGMAVMLPKEGAVVFARF
jgi:ribonuclease Z